MIKQFKLLKKTKKSKRDKRSTAKQHSKQTRGGKSLNVKKKKLNSSKLVTFKRGASAIQDAQQIDTISHPTPIYPPNATNYEQWPKKIDIFRFPIINWQYRWQRPQQICRQFALHGYRVFYFSLETTAIGDPNATLADIQSKLEFKEVDSHTWEVKLCSYSSLNAYRDAIEHPLDQQFMEWSIEALKRIFHIQHTVSIVDLPFWSSLVFRLKDNKTIYDCMDEHSGFSNTSSKLLALEPTLMTKADIVVASSEYLYQKATLYNTSVCLIRNAGEYEHFAMNRVMKQITDLPDLKGPVIGYVGAIADWFDTKLVHELAIRNPDWSFVLIGCTYFSDTKELGKCSNVFLLGEKPYGELPSYIQLFDVCIIPFIVNNLTLATNPVKVYEYLAAGKPVVSSDLPELRTMQEYVRLASGTLNFEDMIREALLETSHTEYINKRRLFAAKHTWEERYQSFEAVISKSLYPKISIIVVTHNNLELSKQCIDSLLKCTINPLCEFIIIDNASTDGTAPWLNKLAHPQIKTILLPENTGYATGNTIGMINSNGDYLVLLNNDTVVPDGWLPRLLRPFSIDKQIGAVGPMSNHVGNDQRLDVYVGDVSHAPNSAWLNEFYQLYKHEVRYTELLGFYCVAIKREVIEKVGYFDPEFGTGMFEDDDYCLRMQRSGYKLAIAEDAFVYHHGSATFKQWADKKYHALFHKNKAYYEKKWGITWQQPKMPMNLFIHTTDSREVADLAAANGQRIVLLRCPEAWDYPHSAWQQKVLENCYDRQRLVFALVKFYYGTPIHGIRKIGPNLYFTSNAQLLEHTRFDEIYTLTSGEERGGDAYGDSSRLSIGG
ncbi:glycosyltransferase [Paenibacillus elgii]|uniref:glycosyltransferase n=1 Tax=Paenibacillus elgii TaxID=189691 RepID=UPI0020402411|nr:glycosyltransferase [Paenibacillus elgii]MCM3270693.1 glycosyltransferase [Paenibacillus elgii]